ncbi:MAG: CvpA family protein [Candidatus Limnocylindrales bacterium]|jgi:uncharacterized membrane protein required for colicin V production
MDLGSFLTSLTLADLALLLIYLGAFALGFMQGGTRGVLVLLDWVFAFVIGITVWQPLGDWLGGQWTFYQHEYTQMLAFLIGFFVALVIGAILIVSFSKRAPLLPRWPFADELLGGFLFVIFALLVTGAVMVGLDTVYPGGQSNRVDVPWLTTIADALQGSVVGGWIDAIIATFILTVFAPIIPDAFEALTAQ